MRIASLNVPALARPAGIAPFRSHHAVPAREAARAIVLGGLVAAVLWLIDVTIFCYAHGIAPIRALHWIAGGLIGREAAYAGGLATAGLGVALHLLIALTMAAAYTAASLTLRWPNRHPVPAGLLYGLLLYFVMNYLVVPLSALGRRGELGTVDTALCIAGHLLLVGLPIALFARRLER